jgi:hypothetical protein
MMMFRRKRRLLMLRILGMRLLTRLLLLVCSLSLVSLLFLSRCGLNVETEVQLDPGTGKYTVTNLVPTQSQVRIATRSSYTRIADSRDRDEGIK